jgi:hypothetical protein
MGRMRTLPIVGPLIVERARGVLSHDELIVLPGALVYGKELVTSRLKSVEGFCHVEAVDAFVAL